MLVGSFVVTLVDILVEPLVVTLVEILVLILVDTIVEGPLFGRKADVHARFVQHFIWPKTMTQTLPSLQYVPSRQH